MFGSAFEHDTCCDKPCKICNDNHCSYMRIACDIKFHICDKCFQDLIGQWVVYIVRCSDDSLYTGSTNNLKNRLIKHNSGKGAKYTKTRFPVELVFCKKYDSKSEALINEAKIKKLTRKEKLEYIGLK